MAMSALHEANANNQHHHLPYICVHITHVTQYTQCTIDWMWLYLLRLVVERYTQAGHTRGPAIIKVVLCAMRRVWAADCL